MNHGIRMSLTLILSVLVTACSQNQQLSHDAAELALAQWAHERKYSIDAITIIGIVTLPEQSAARADLSFDDLWGFDEESDISGIEGPATAAFTRYDDGRWVLTGITTQNRTWDKLNFEAVADSARLQELKDANLALVAENQRDLIARDEAASFMGKSMELMLSIRPIRTAITEFAIANGRMPTADEVQVEPNPSALVSSATWDGTNIVVVGNVQALGVTDSEVAFSVRPTMNSAGGVSFECEATAGAQYLTGCN